MLLHKALQGNLRGSPAEAGPKVLVACPVLVCLRSYLIRVLRFRHVVLRGMVRLAAFAVHVLFDLRHTCIFF